MTSKTINAGDGSDTAEMARLSGYQVVKSCAGSQATPQVSKDKADAMALDIMMPDLSG